MLYALEKKKKKMETAWPPSRYWQDGLRCLELPLQVRAAQLHQPLLTEQVLHPVQLEVLS